MTESLAKPKIGFIGLGIMGGPMVSNLTEAGYEVSLFDMAPGRAATLAELLPNARARATPREVGEHSDIVVTMLPNGRVVSEVVFSVDGLAHGLAPGSLLLDTSSSEPWITRETANRLGQQDVSMVDAPVSGAEVGAQTATLVFMVGGADANVSRVRPVLSAMGDRIFHLGGIGAGHTMKCLNNLITAITLEATAEGLAIGTRAGLDPGVMTDVLNESTGGSWVAKTHIHQRILNRKFDDPFKLELMLKDMGIALDLARSMGLPAPLSAIGHQLWQAAHLDRGQGASVSELVRWVEATMHTEIRTADRK